MTPSAAVLRQNMMRRLEFLVAPLSYLARTAGFTAKRFYPIVSGEPKSITLTTLDDVAVVLRTTPWELLSTDEIPNDLTDGAMFNSSKLLRERANLESLPRKLRYNITHRRGKSFSLKTLDLIAESSGETASALIDGSFPPPTDGPEVEETTCKS